MLASAMKSCLRSSLPACIGTIRLMATGTSSPSGPSATARNTSPIPPRAIRGPMA